MCGIAGIVRWGKRERLQADLTRMTQAVAHRGPDGEGLWVGDGVAIGHRRLSIIDLEGGAQPMWDETGRFGITYNGELYNYQQLRHTLIGHGRRFLSRSDTEVVLQAFAQWGPAALNRFRGMFAFAIVDLLDRKVFLARDQFGIKPLVYRVGRDFFAFASEINALKHVDDEPCTGSLLAVDLFLRYQYIPAPTTIFREVHKLAPAHWMEVSFDGHSSAPKRYWDFQFEPEEGIGAERWVDRFEETLNESVSAHLVADVPFGVFLSGGIDSTLVAGSMRRQLGEGTKGFSIGFEEARVSELGFATAVAREWSFELVSEIVGPGSIDGLPRMIEHCGEPFGDASLIPTWHVARLARRHVPMVLSGDGGDEGFAGYDSHRTWLESQLRPSLSRLKHEPSARAAAQLLRSIATRSFGGDVNEAADWERLVAYSSEPLRRSLWRPEHAAVATEPGAAFALAGADGRHQDRLGFAQYLDFRTYLPNDILTKVDLASMAHGLEVRTPLIDLRVLDLARRIPAALRFGRDGTRVITKHIPKLALEKRFAKEFVHRPKQGFAIPRREWLRTGGPARAMLDQLLAEDVLGDLFVPSQLSSLLRDFDSGRIGDGVPWLLLVLALWRSVHRKVVFS